MSGNVRRPGNYEVELGMPARDIVYGLAGGPPSGRKVKCWFPGGSSAPVLLEHDLDLPYDFESMANAGSMLGSGAIIVIDDSVPIVDVALSVARFYRHESCGKCTPCREGTNWTVKMLERIDKGEATPMDIEIMAQVQTNIIGNCLCVLGDSMAMPIGSMIEKFRPEFEAHMEAARRKNNVELGDLDPSELAADRQSGPTPVDVGNGRHRGAGGHQLDAAPDAEARHLRDRRTRRLRARGLDARRRRQARRRRDPRTSVTSPSSARRSAPAACASWRSRACRSCRRPARPR